MIRCEICGEPINDRTCIVLLNAPNEKRGVHHGCMAGRITYAFRDCIGTQDDDVARLIFDAIDDTLTDNTPDEPDGGGHLPPMKEE